jgi:glycosyltransferase involved in cell wall biosynthesis
VKIFIGLNNIASIFHDLKMGFDDLGIDTLIISGFSGSHIINEYADYNTAKIKEYVPIFKPKRLAYLFRRIWSRLVDIYYLRLAMKECDVFLFISDSFFPSHKDLKILRSKKKKIISVFVGDDVRWYYSMKQEFTSYGLQPIEYPSADFKTIQTLANRLKRIRTAEKYSDFIFSRLDQGQLQLRPYHRWNMMVTPEKFIENSSQRVIPIIAHAPSSREIKGTKYVLEAFDRLRLEGYEFELAIIENVANYEAVKMYGNADILVDQLLCPGAGRLATEALASGTIVLSNMAYDVYPQMTPDDCPIIDVNPATFYEKLKWLITDFDFRKEHAKKGRPYVEKYLDVSLFCEKVVALVKGESIPYDYTPEFFRNKYIAESENEIALLNRWTEKVKMESWYSEGIQSGKRDNLYF